MCLVNSIIDRKRLVYMYTQCIQDKIKSYICRVCHTFHNQKQCDLVVYINKLAKLSKRDGFLLFKINRSVDLNSDQETVYKRNLI